MSPSGKTVFVFGCYLLALGATLLLVPNLLLGLFGFPQTEEVWIRILGLLVIYLGIYYSLAGRRDLRPFIAATVPVRASVLAFFVVFVAAGMVSPMLLVLGLPDLLGAAWTWKALRNERFSVALAGN
ncbi:hypothetical protein [Aquipseudomonas alcaligenes]|uniref:Uncharacterized protein n=1 Tax=Aquipseudomonas alcaligenes TaxID=43263 RepID=A0A1N6XJF6_AQUAC|nr:hypothetical protein [Pseudomonas alcaligenes]SIR02495.1 hypothetical protein SAMN05878282_11320 [Pseudomonas alcaligenes]